MNKIAICITLPSKIKWSDYQKELEKVKYGDYQMNFKLPTIPKKVHIGDRCYICHKGKLIGWMQIVDIKQLNDFDCLTTGTHWKSGCYICRSGKFHYLTQDISMKGFQGYKYINEID